MSALASIVVYIMSVVLICSPEVWPIEGRRDVNLSKMCTGENQALTFGLNEVYGNPAGVSRSIKTNQIPLGK